MPSKARGWWGQVRKEERPRNTLLTKDYFKIQSQPPKKPVSICYHLSVEIKIFLNTLQLKTRIRNKLLGDVADRRQLSTI